TLAIADAQDAVSASVGIDPHRAASEGGSTGELRELATHPRVVAIGETGLDYHYGADAKREQRALLEAQLELAEHVQKPVVIHCREAAADTAGALAPFRGTVVLHCFSEPALLPAALERGYYVSFAGNVTYPRSSALREAAVHVPAERLLVETDSPYLAPQPRRGRPNEPANVVHTVAALAEARDEDVAELGRRTAANARAAFGLP
ncbi:MAG: TatD family hydrolase, partial [Actinomycetota bacterium]|nr:TatD family hydrolase [Actinomycetota bacterium]